MAKKRKMAGPAAVAKKKQRSGGEGGNRKGKPEKETKDNLFETLWTRKKFDVLGKKQKKGPQKRVGQSRSLAVEKRKKTLLQEYKQQGKGNVFEDRRFGERDEGLAEEDKAILRFQKERQAQINRKSKFTLPDDDEEEETLTHGGMALSNVDDFNDNDSMQDDDDLADLDEDAVRHLNFGGGFSAKNGENNDPQQPKSKKEVMDDIIAKSKFYKAQKAKEKDEDEELKEKLDNDFSELLKSRALLSFRPTRKDGLKSLSSKNSSKVGSTSGGKDSPTAEQDKPDEFDKLTKEMIFDIRGHAGDRLKTSEERVKEERERLEDLERKRKKRMLGVADSDEESDEEPDSRRQKKKRTMEVSGDDLGENFVLDEEQGGKGWVDEVLARKGDAEADSSQEDGSDEVDGDTEDEGGDDDLVDGTVSGGEWSEDDVETAPNNGILAGKMEIVAREKERQSGKGKKVHTDKEIDEKQASDNLLVFDVLPFVIDAPQTLGEFQALVDQRPIEDLEVAIRRIRTCNAISLAAENRKKMQVFYNVLLQYFGSLAMQRPFLLSRITLITKPLIELSSETPYFAAHCARQRLMNMHDQLTDKLKTPDGRSCWPSLRTLLLLRFWSMIFPPSDFRHPVMTPTILLMAEYLMRCRVTSSRDIAVGSFLCALLLSLLRESRRFCPEILNFIMALLVSTLPVDASRQARSLCPAFMVELAASNPWLQLQSKDPRTVQCFDLDFFALMTSEECAPVFDSDSFRCGILQSILWTLKGVVSLYGDLVSFPEAFSPLLLILQAMDKEVMLPEKLQCLLSEVAKSIEVNLKDSECLRQPLRMRIKKPTPIKQFNPKFEENFVRERDYDPDRERAEKKKLQRRVKREARGAARELRKDNYFLSEEKSKEKAIFEEERKEKYGRAMQFLQEQESAFKSGQLGKGKGRKRRK